MLMWSVMLCSWSFLSLPAFLRAAVCVCQPPISLLSAQGLSEELQIVTCGVTHSTLSHLWVFESPPPRPSPRSHGLPQHHSSIHPDTHTHTNKYTQIHPHTVASTHTLLWARAEVKSLRLGMRMVMTDHPQEDHVMSVPLLSTRYQMGRNCPALTLAYSSKCHQRWWSLIC